MQCSPYHYKFFDQHGTCFSKAQLINIAKSINVPHTNTKKQDLWRRINTKMLGVCEDGNEHCWLAKTNKDYHFNAHVPKQPAPWSRDSRTWLTNVDILNVMVQYEKRHRKFKFFGVFPIDFAEKYGMSQCISIELCNLNLNKLKSYSQFGCVFNLDKHYQSGSHWVSVFFNTDKSLPNYGFYFFDSTSSKIPVEILNFAKSVQKQVADPASFRIHQNVVQKQFKNTECGMFSLHFLIECLKNKPFIDIVNNPFYDDDVHKLRNKLFRKK
jgi:hypothetical protein